MNFKSLQLHCLSKQIKYYGVQSTNLCAVNTIRTRPSSSYFPPFVISSFITQLCAKQAFITASTNKQFQPIMFTLLQETSKLNGTDWPSEGGPKQFLYHHLVLFRLSSLSLHRFLCPSVHSKYLPFLFEKNIFMWALKSVTNKLTSNGDNRESVLRGTLFPSSATSHNNSQGQRLITMVTVAHRGAATEIRPIRRKTISTPRQG
jgi:hypothetical protein